MQSTTSLPLTPPSNQGSSAQTTQHAQMVHHAQVATGGMARLAPASSPGAMASAAGATLEPQAQPVYTRLTGANLTGANLTNANLMGANLTGANLTNANLNRLS